jgi:uncharacterized protein (DUF2252 family)
MKTPTPAARHDILRLRRAVKMSRSPHAYVRGNTEQYYQWLHSQRGHALPHGPAIWICGDCHVGNLGPLADADGQVKVQVRDFDQTVIGNPAHDLVRLGLSLATAARGSRLPGVVTVQMLEHLLDGYQRALMYGEDAAAMQKPDSVKVAMRAAVKRSWKNLAREQMTDAPRKIFTGSKFWPLSKAEQHGIAQLFAMPQLVALARAIKSRPDDATVKVVDAAYWVKGCSSLGLLRYAVLLSIDDDYCLMDIKQAVHASAPRYPHVSMPRDNARRVAAGAAQMSPALGDRMLAQRFLDHGVFIRELLPQDLKLDIDQLSQKDANRTANYLGYVVGCAHARQMEPEVRQAWLCELKSGQGGACTLPTWLWDSVVQLVASHEAGYLEHCRKYAPGMDALR